MIILTTSASAQTLSVIPRQYNDSQFTMSIKDDSTNVTVFYDITTGTTLGNYLNFDNVFNPLLVENHFFDLHLYIDYNYWNTNNSFWNLYDILWQVDSDYKEDIFRDKIFCTDQDIDQLNDNDHYELNKGQYKSYDGFDNTYIVR
jgi:hypothetical protein|tara:strand:- start:1416 stop:1850 length:435 start_codon:yes stop_codon:yes gene_type:complete